MKAKFNFLITILMMSSWFGLDNVSGNQAISKLDTFDFIHNMESDFPYNLTFSPAKKVPVKNLLYTKVDTTRDDYIFISVRMLANRQRIKTTGLNSCINENFGNKEFDYLTSVYFFDPGRDRRNI